jgi:Zn-dependent protease
MRQNNPFSRLNLDRDRIFWLVIAAILVVYALVVLNTLRFISTLLALLVAVTVHECAHAWIADQLGDPTGRLSGRVSLNPLVHLDPLGSIMMVITSITGIGIGWGKPVPVSPYRLKYGARVGNGLVALAGAVANVCAAILFGLLLRLLPTLPDWLFIVLDTLVWINIIIAVFNLLPVPPLDGHSVLIALISVIKARWAQDVVRFLVGLERYGALILIAVILVPQFLGISILGMVIRPPSFFLYNLIVGA